jgi:hypothetical protein
MSQARVGVRTTAIGTTRSPRDVAAVLSSVPVFISMLLPWWDDQKPLSLATHWPKVTLMAGLFLTVSGLASLRRGVSSPWMTLMGTIVLGVSLIAFYFRVDNSVWFAEAPFTIHVGTGFFYGLLGFGWATVSCVGQFVTHLEQGRPERTQRHAWLGVLLTLALVAVAVIGVYRWNQANVDRITLDPGIEAPPPLKTE